MPSHEQMQKTNYNSKEKQNEKANALYYCIYLILINDLPLTLFF